MLLRVQGLYRERAPTTTGFYITFTESIIPCGGARVDCGSWRALLEALLECVHREMVISQNRGPPNRP